MRLPTRPERPSGLWGPGPECLIYAGQLQVGRLFCWTFAWPPHRPRGAPSGQLFLSSSPTCPSCSPQLRSLGLGLPGVPMGFSDSFFGVCAPPLPPTPN